MTRLFPSQLAERKQVHDAEMAELSKYVSELNSAVYVTTQMLVNAGGRPCVCKNSSDFGVVGLSSFDTNESLSHWLKITAVLPTVWAMQSN